MPHPRNEVQSSSHAPRRRPGQQRILRGRTVKDTFARDAPDAFRGSVGRTRKAKTLGQRVTVETLPPLTVFRQDPFAAVRPAQGPSRRLTQNRVGSRVRPRTFAAAVAGPGC